jgi:hypothetical protein
MPNRGSERGVISVRWGGGVSGPLIHILKGRGGGSGLLKSGRTRCRQSRSSSGRWEDRTRHWSAAQ